MSNFRTEVLQLPLMATGDRLKVLGALPNIYAVGEALLPTPSDWPRNAVTTGFFFLEEALTADDDDSTTASKGESGCGGGGRGKSEGGSGGGRGKSEGGSGAGSAELSRLKAWVSANPRPVVVNFGSMACIDEAKEEGEGDGEVRKRVFCAILCLTPVLKCIILPRQARDKHRESTQNKDAFLHYRETSLRMRSTLRCNSGGLL